MISQYVYEAHLVTPFCTTSSSTTMPSSQISLDRAYLTAIWLETLFYGALFPKIFAYPDDWLKNHICLLLLSYLGINLLLFFSYLFIVRYKRRISLSKIIIGVAVMMFLFSTVHVSLGFYRLIEGFIVLKDPIVFFSDVSIPANVAKVTIHTVNSILGDSIMVSFNASRSIFELIYVALIYRRCGDAITSGGKAGCRPSFQSFW